MTPNVTKEHLIREADSLFENLVPLPELQVLAQRWLRKPEPVRARTIYKWVRDGMPHEKIHGDLYFPIVKAATWLRRT